MYRKLARGDGIRYPPSFLHAVFARLIAESEALKWNTNFLKSVDWQLVIPAYCFAVPEAELQLEVCPVVFKDIGCRLGLVCREVELPFVGLVRVGIPDGKTNHPLQGFGICFQPI